MDVPGSDPWLAAELARLLRFGVGARHRDGGFGWLDDDGVLDPDRPRALWITARMTHVHALATLLDVPGAAALADHGLAALAGVFHDDAHGGWWAGLDAAGAPTTRDKTAYEHAFVVLAASSAEAAGRPGAGEVLDEALEVLDRFVDHEHAMVAEQWDEGFERLDDYRGLNATMHGVEALLAAADVRGDAVLRDLATRITTAVVRDLAPAHAWLLPEHFTPAWEPVLDHHRDQPAHPFRPYGATLGHSFEWARLALQVHAGAGPDAEAWMVDHAVALADTATRLGWAVDGADGFVYTVDWDGTPVVRERMHWVAAEAVAATSALHRATGNPRHRERYDAWWAHVEAWFVDRDRGSWVHERSPSGGASTLTWTGKPDLYHAVQATLLPRLPLAPALAAALAGRDGGG
ncbi:AGE family epimerase/isomerase [Nocardioides dongxiaopingii]|nr:AGE family epimerase/isomerase [Nocardioides sp. S-1144]